MNFKQEGGVFLITALSSGHKKQKVSDEHDANIYFLKLYDYQREL